MCPFVFGGRGCVCVSVGKRGLRRRSRAVAVKRLGALATAKTTESVVQRRGPKKTRNDRN